MKKHTVSGAAAPRRGAAPGALHSRPPAPAVSAAQTPAGPAPDALHSCPPAPAVSAAQTPADPVPDTLHSCPPIPPAPAPAAWKQRAWTMLYAGLRRMARRPALYQALMRLVLAAVTLPCRAPRTAQDAAALPAGTAGQPVTDQSRLGALRYGRSTAAAAGCEAISVYNALLLCGRPAPPLTEVLHRAERAGILMRGGHFGANPYRLGRLLQACGLHGRLLVTPAALRAQAVPGDIVLFCVWTKTGAVPPTLHTFAARCENSGYTTYNQRYAARALTPAEAARFFAEDLFLAAWLVTPA